MSTAKLLVARLRELADLLVAHPELEKFPELFEAAHTFSTHEFGDRAAQLDVFADFFGVVIEHRVHGPHSGEPGARYSSVQTEIEGRCIRLQAYTEDYEKATGKTVPLPPEEVKRRMLAEVEHWSKTPFAHDQPPAATS